MNKTVISPIALAVLLLGGCSFIPTYERPEAPVPASYAQGGTASAAAASADWQDYFTDPRLQRLIETALANNRDLRVAALAIEQARAQFQIQRAAQWPSVGVGATASRAPSASTGSLTNTYSVGGVLSAWELDFFGRLGSLKEQALAQYLASEEGRKAVQVSLVAGVANGWLTLQADEELLDISRRTLATREDSLALAKMRREVGLASDLDYRQAESLAEAARATLAQQQRQRALDENALALLLGQPLPDDIRASLAGSRLASVPAMADLPAGLPSDLLTQRPDIRQVATVDRGQCQHRRSARGLLPQHHTHRPSRHGQYRAIGSVQERKLGVHADGVGIASRVQCRTQPSCTGCCEGGPRDRGRPVRKSDPERLPGGVRCPGQSKPAGRAIARPASPGRGRGRAVAPVGPALPKWCRQLPRSA